LFSLVVVNGNIVMVVGVVVVYNVVVVSVVIKLSLLYYRDHQIDSLH